MAVGVASSAADPCKTTDEQTRCATACDAQKYTSCAQLGLALINSGDRSQLARGVALVEKACTGKDALGCGALGSLYMGGIGVRRDEKRAVLLLEDGCKRNDALSCESLGGYYGQGGGSDKIDLRAAAKRAAPYYERACKMQRPAACAFLGTMIHEGLLDGNRRRVPDLLDTACRGDVNVACKFLGDLYAKGELVGKNVNKANELYAKACKLGYDRGCTSLPR